MKKLIKSAILAAAGIGLVTTAAQAQQTPFELGFTKTGSSDYIIDLGNATTLGIGGTSTVDLSSDISASTFNTTFTAGATGVGMAMVSGNPTFGSYDIYATQLRNGGAGTASVAGSSLSTKSHSQGTISGAAASLTATATLTWPTTAGASLVDSGNSFTKTVVQNNTGNFFNKSGISTSSPIGSTGILFEDLYEGTVTGGYAYEGYFTFNGNADSLTFTPATLAVPEPSTYGLFAALGLLALCVRSQFVRKNA